MKEKQQIIRTLAQDEADKILLAYVLERLQISQSKNYLVHTRFLDLRQRAMVQQAIRMVGGLQSCVFWGGYPEAERVCAIFFPSYLTPEQAIENSPIVLLRAQKNAADTLSHRDYLGSLMGLQIERDRIGDILVGEHGAELLVMEEIADFVQMNLVQAGRKHLSVSREPLQSLRMPILTEYQGTGSLASLRIDAVIALIFSISRSDAQEFIQKGLVFINQQPCLKPGKEINLHDQITVRGKGRCKITDFGGTSRKGRQFIQYLRTN